jgi:PAS domain S-box-containing protein
MRQIITKALQKLNKMTPEQTRDILVSAAEEIYRLETVLDSLTDGILVCDTDHNLILANKYAERLLPISHEESGLQAANTPVWTRIRDEKLAGFFATSLENGDRIEEHELNVEAGGKQRLLSISVLPLVRERQVSGSLIYVADITEKRSREARLRRMESLASLTTLAAGVAHEIKNPLGSLSIHVQLIQKATNANRAMYFEDHPESKDREIPIKNSPMEYFTSLDKYLSIVNEEIERLNRIVVDFLFAVRPMNMDFHMGNLNALIGEVVDFVQFEIKGAGITCDLDLAPDLPLISFDEPHLKQAILNLIKNALAAMSNGGRLGIKTRVVEGELLIEVSDTGVGIPEENFSKIFDPYFTTKESGSGLGLTLVFKIVREHQGEITLRSREGEGACFTIALPIPQREKRLISYAGQGDAQIAAVAQIAVYTGETDIEAFRRYGGFIGESE